jgi:DNA-binding beta-propeller fold protein YncE
MIGRSYPQTCKRIVGNTVRTFGKQSLMTTLILALCLFTIGAPALSVENLKERSKVEPGPTTNAPSSVVYIESNVGETPGHNSILAFRRDSAGHLTPIGEFPTGGTGVHPIESNVTNLATTLGPLDSDQSIILNREGTRLFAVNAGSDTIAVFDVRNDGSLVPVKGSPFPSGGVNPVSVGLAEGGDILVVVNKDYDLSRPGFDVALRAPNYTTFRVNPQGKLIRVPQSTIAATPPVNGIGPGFSNPTQALIAPDGRLVFDTDFFGFTLHSFVVQPNGRLERADSHTLPASEFIPHPLISRPQGLVIPLGLFAHPRERIFYVGMVFEGKLGVLEYNSEGQFHFVRSTPAGAGICWVTINSSGNRIYTTNTLADTVSVLDSSDPLNPVEIQEFALAGPPAGPFQLALDSRGEYLYVITQKTLDVFPVEANALHVLKIAADGTIAAQTDRVEIPVFPSSPQGVVAR